MTVAYWIEVGSDSSSLTVIAYFCLPIAILAHQNTIAVFQLVVKKYFIYILFFLYYFNYFLYKNNI